MAEKYPPHTSAYKPPIVDSAGRVVNAPQPTTTTQPARPAPTTTAPTKPEPTTPKSVPENTPAPGVKPEKTPPEPTEPTEPAAKAKKAAAEPEPKRGTHMILDLDRETTILSEPTDDNPDRSCLDIVQPGDDDTGERCVSLVGTVQQLDLVLDRLASARAAGYRV